MNINMQIADLPYLENISEGELIFAAAGALVIASATVVGDTGYVATSGTITKQDLPNDGSIVFGTGTAVAVGDYPTAEVIVAGYGDIVVGQTQSYYIPPQDTAVATGFVVAIDVPN